MKHYLKFIFIAILALSSFYVHAGHQLFYLIKGEQPEKLRSYLGSNRHLVNGLITDNNEEEITPLIAAILHAKNMETIKILVNEFNADIRQALPDGRTPLIVSLMNNTLAGKVTDFLYDKGVFPVEMLFDAKDQLKRKQTLEKADFSILEQNLIEKMSPGRQQAWSQKKQQIEEEYKQKSSEDRVSPPPRKRLKTTAAPNETEKLQQALEGFIAEEDVDETDYVWTTTKQFMPELWIAIIPSWMSVNNTPFMQNIVHPQETEYQKLAENMKRYMKILFFVYDKLKQKLANFDADDQLESIIAKMSRLQCIVNAHQAIEADTSDTVLLLDVTGFKTQHQSFLADSKTLHEYLEFIDETPYSLPEAIKLLAHVYVWMGADISISGTMLSFLKRAGFLEMQLAFLNLGGKSETMPLNLKLANLLEDVKQTYPMHADNFITLVKEIYAVKVQLFTTGM